MKNNWQHLSVEELFENRHGWQLVDIRDQTTFQQGHIPDAINLNNNNFQQYIESHDFEKPLVVICYHGNSSKGAAAVLSNVGFETVYSLDGGMAIWAVQYPELVDNS